MYLFNKYLPCSCHILDIVLSTEETVVNEIFVPHLRGGKRREIKNKETDELNNCTF